MVKTSFHSSSFPHKGRVKEAIKSFPANSYKVSIQVVSLIKGEEGSYGKKGTSGLSFHSSSFPHKGRDHRRI